MPVSMYVVLLPAAALAPGINAGEGSKESNVFVLRETRNILVTEEMGIQTSKTYHENLRWQREESLGMQFALQ